MHAVPSSLQLLFCTLPQLPVVGAAGLGKRAAAAAAAAAVVGGGYARFLHGVQIRIPVDTQNSVVVHDCGGGGGRGRGGVFFRLFRSNRRGLAQAPSLPQAPAPRRETPGLPRPVVVYSI